MIAHAAAADFAATIVNKFLIAIGFPLVVLLMAVAVVLFLYGCFEYIINAGDSGAQTKGRNHILYGLIGLLVMTSAYAILSIAVSTFGIPTPDRPF